jgi:hypothetical protein
MHANPLDDLIEELEYEIVLAQRFGKANLIPGIERAIEVAGQFKEVDPDS